MGIILFAIIFGILIGILVVIISVIRKGKQKNKDEEKYFPTTQDQQTVEYIRKGIFKIKNGGYRVLLDIPSVNISLMEWGEKEATMQQYAGILTGLEYPIQFFQQSRKIDINSYFDKIDKKMMNERNPFILDILKKQKESLKDLIKERSILTKKIYLVIPYDEEVERVKTVKKKKKNKKGKKEEQTQENDISKEEERFEKARKILMSRATNMQMSFRRFDIPVEILNDAELLELLYSVYNKNRSTFQPLKNVNPDDYLTLYVEGGEIRGN